MSAIGRFLSTTGEVMTKDALNKQSQSRAAEITAKRDAKLAAYRSGENAASREFTAGQNALTREQTAANRAQQQANSDRSFSLQEKNANRAQSNSDRNFEQSQTNADRSYEAQKAQQKSLDELRGVQIEGMKTSNETAAFVLEDKKAIAAAQRIIANRDLPIAERQAAVDELNARRPQSKDKYQLKVTPGEFGEETVLHLFNSSNGDVRELNMDGTLKPREGDVQAGAPAEAEAAKADTKKPLRRLAPIGTDGFTPDNPATPQNNDEVEALKPGSVYIPPGGGEPMVRGEGSANPSASAQTHRGDTPQAYNSSLFPPMDESAQNGILARARNEAFAT